MSAFRSRAPWAITTLLLGLVSIAVLSAFSLLPDIRAAYPSGGFAEAATQFQFARTTSDVAAVFGNDAVIAQAMSVANRFDLVVFIPVYGLLLAFGYAMLAGGFRRGTVWLALLPTLAALAGDVVETLAQIRISLEILIDVTEAVEQGRTSADIAIAPAELLTLQFGAHTKFIGLGLGALGCAALSLMRARPNWLLAFAGFACAATTVYAELAPDSGAQWATLARGLFWLALIGTAFKRVFWPPPVEMESAAPYAVRRVIRSLAGARLPLGLAAAGAAAAIAIQTHHESAVRALSPHGAPITAMAFSQDGLWLAVASEDGEIRVWPTSGGPSHRIVNPDGPARPLLTDIVTIEQDGELVLHQRLVFATAMGRARGVDIETGAPLLPDDAIPVSYTPPLLAMQDGVLVAAIQNAEGVAIGVNVNGMEASQEILGSSADDRVVSLQTLNHPVVVFGITAAGGVWSNPDFTLSPASNPANIRVYTVGATSLGLVDGRVRHLGADQAGSTFESMPLLGDCPGAPLTDHSVFVDTGDERSVVEVLIVTDAARLCRIRQQNQRPVLDSPISLREAPTAAAFASGNTILLGFADGSVRQADMAGAFRGRLGGHGARVTTIAISPSGRHAATGAADGSVQIIDLSPSAAPVYATPNAIAETADRQGRRQWAALIDRIAPPPVQAAAAEHPGFTMLREAGLAGPYSEESIGCQFAAAPNDAQIARVRAALDSFSNSLLRETDPAQTAAANLGAGCAYLALGGEENVVEAIRHFEHAAAIAPTADSAQQQASAVQTPPPPPAQASEVHATLMSLDRPALRSLLARGWDPNAYVDTDNNAALHDLMVVCERNPSHDRDALVSMARILINGGADKNQRNGFGDTPLRIASSPRYCGADHPVISLLR